MTPRERARARQIELHGPPAGFSLAEIDPEQFEAMIAKAKADAEERFRPRYLERERPTANPGSRRLRRSLRRAAKRAERERAWTK